VTAPLVLGIETSCDETGAGLVRGHELLADAIASSVEQHARFGGVVPEVASRAHLEAMVPAVDRALATAGEARERLQRWHDHEQGLESPRGLWAIVPLGSGVQPPVGTIPLLPLADADGPAGLTEVGWHLHPDHQGRGLATEAAAAVLAVAAEAGIGPVLAMTDLDNIRSQAVAARLGMRDEGITQRWFGLTMRQFRYLADA